MVNIRHDYPLVMTYIAIENGPFIVDLPFLKMVILCSYVNVYQRVWGACYQ